MPTKMAVIAFGNLKLMMMYSHVSLLAGEPNKLLKTSFIGMATCPNEIFNSNDTSKSKVNIENKIVFRVWNIYRFICQSVIGSFVNLNLFQILK